jgi:hypothetical protein
MQEEPFIRAVVPGSLGYKNSTFVSQKSDVPVLSLLISLSRVDLPDDHFFVPISQSAPRFSECCFPVGVYRHIWGGLFARPIKVILDRASRFS